MPGSHKGYTTPHKCATFSDSKRNQPSDRDQQARHKLQERLQVSMQIFMALST